jgi:hypothetical protein
LILLPQLLLFSLFIFITSVLSQSFPAMAGTKASGPTETSPLLFNQPSENATRSIDPGSGIAPEGTNPHIDDNATNEQDGGDIERQTSNGLDDTSNDRGIPNVKARMKYIFPAVALGVSSFYNSMHQQG